jgi:hypothetical protein
MTGPKGNPGRARERWRFIRALLLLALIAPFDANAQTTVPTAPSLPVTGSCGAANGVPTSTAPGSGLCSMGTASAVTGSGPWTWSCGFSSCSAPLAVTSGACGTASSVAAISAPTTGLCSAGVASPVSGTGPWTWSCTGSGGGTTASCSVPTTAINGACGAANGVATTSVPTTRLCSAGAASPVSGTGPWTWTCLGGGGRMTVPCGAGP